ncbi:hypothetical protein [Streptomyces griseoaurantiacus]|uniref:hypothetical protein n=1 Tax=Streptomyces griseoaurantiacus TaxID=68213 RepID=UPI002ED20A3B|nr:hypothetical protein OHA67_30660 [Streptomyces jietaisiensis]
MTTATVATEVSRAPGRPATPDRPSSTCQVKLGFSAPVLDCAVPARGADGTGGCPQAGGVCIGCAVPGIPDAFLPLREEPAAGGPPASVTGPYGAVLRRLRGIAAGRTPARHPSPARGADHG